MVRREVYAKGEMLRKLVLVHKAGDLPFPWLLYWTDYSAKRAEPLKVTLAQLRHRFYKMMLDQQPTADIFPVWHYTSVSS